MTRAAVAKVSASPNANLHRALRAVRARVRAQRALDAWVLLGAVACAGLVAAALLTSGAASGGALLWIAVIAPVLGALAWSLRPVPVHPLAVAVDRALETPDLIASAVSFEALPEAEQTPLMRLCIAQAERASAALVPSRLAALHPPPALAALCALLLLFIGLTHAPARSPVVALTARPPAEPALDAETSAAFESELEQLKAQPLDPEAQAILAKLNALLEGIAAGEIDRAEALAELRRLEDKLRSLLAADPKALQEALENIGRALAGTPEAKPLEKALTENWPEAAQELRKLSERVAAGQLKPEAEQRLAKSLERAAAERASDERQAAVDEAKRELDRLLRKQEEQKAQGDQAKSERDERDERLLKRKQRELDQLEREQQQAKNAERELDRLKRELDAASNALKEKDRQAASQNMQNAANELERAAQQQQARNQAGKLAQQLAQLRAEIAQRRGENGQEGSGDSSDSGSPVPLSMQRFGRMAAGKPSGGEGQQAGEPGGAAMQPQQGAGQGQGQEQGQGSAGERMAQLRQGGGDAPGEQAALLEASGASNEDGRGEGAGLGGKPKDGAATAGSGQHVDTRIEGEKRGGPSRSEVIFESGQRGFSDEGYAKVHDDYVRHAESVLEREQIPGGYRYYVRRYFQLIRPREGAQGAP